MDFNELGLGDCVLKAVEDAGYTTPTPIQQQAIPIVLMGRDILGCAQTGTGKTASFTLPMIDILASGRAKARMPRSLILEPTRELAAQVAENFDTYGRYHKLSKALLIGGSSMNNQMKVIERGPDVLIATPGRLLDLFDRGHLLMSDVKTLVIDEADRMLDMGFIPDVERIVSLISPIRQTLFFSATMAPEIRCLADKFLINPKEITVARPSTSAETITQGLVMIAQTKADHPDKIQKEKRAALRRIIADQDVRDALIFCNRKRDIGTLYLSMKKHGYSVGQLHGDMTQPARMEMLKRFKNNEFNYLICSDVAARGLDIPALSHVFNFDVPNQAEDYVHRIGRTGRAGVQGHAFTIAISEDINFLKAISKLIGKKIPLFEDKKNNVLKDIQIHTNSKKFEKSMLVRGTKLKKSRTKKIIGSRKTNEQQNQPDLNTSSQSKTKKGAKKKQRPSKNEISKKTSNEKIKFGDTDQVPAFMQRPEGK